MRKFASVFIGFTLVLLFTSSAFAAALAVTSIGGMDTSGIFYDHWWHTSVNPTLQGTAEANATVTVDIDGAGDNIVADASGNWTYYPTTLAAGDHLVTIVAGAETIAFTLTTGSGVPGDVGTTTTTTTTVPATTKGGSGVDELLDAGIGDYTWIMLIAGFGTLLLGGGAFVYAERH